MYLSLSLSQSYLLPCVTFSPCTWWDFTLTFYHVRPFHPVPDGTLLLPFTMCDLFTLYLMRLYSYLYHVRPFHPVPDETLLLPFTICDLFTLYLMRLYSYLYHMWPFHPVPDETLLLPFTICDLFTLYLMRFYSYLLPCVPFSPCTWCDFNLTLYPLWSFHPVPDETLVTFLLPCRS